MWHAQSIYRHVHTQTLPKLYSHVSQTEPLAAAFQLQKTPPGRLDISAIGHPVAALLSADILHLRGRNRLRALRRAQGNRGIFLVMISDLALRKHDANTYALKQQMKLGVWE